MPAGSGKRVAVIQSNYIPWKGYFDIIHDVDEFVFHDDLQYTKGDWRNRNRIKTASGVRWLTIPVGTSEHRRIADVKLPERAWAVDHWQRLRTAYERAPFFDRFQDYFESLYLSRTWTTLSELNQTLVRGIAQDLLGLTTVFRNSADLDLEGTKAARLVELLSKVGATEYVSGPAARCYIDEGEFARVGFPVVWKDYQGYPEYAQVHPPFRHDVTILDLLFHTGPHAAWYIWGWRDAPHPTPVV